MYFFEAGKQGRLEPLAPLLFRRTTPLSTPDAALRSFAAEHLCDDTLSTLHALLVGIHDEDEEHTHTCGCGCEDDDEDVIIAKIVTNDDGEDEYVEPTDEEFEAVQQAYNALVDEAEKD